MKLPKWNGMTNPSTYIFSLVCFVVGFAVVTVLSLGRITHDYREGPGFNPVSRMPDGRVGLSEFTLDMIGFAVLTIGFVTVTALATWLKN